MAKLSPLDFVAKWQVRFAPNTTFKIEEADFQEFATDIADSFGVTLPNVPEYVPGTSYTKGYLVRYLPPRGQEAFYYALNAGKLTAPGPANTTDWKVVPGPTTATALSQEITLVQAQGIEGDAVVAGRSYLVDFGPDANDNTQTITLIGVSNNSFSKFGTLEINGVRSSVDNVDVFAGTWQQGGGPAYTDAQARAAQLNRVAPAGTTTVLLTAESPRDYGTAASGTFTVDGTGAVQDAGASFRLGAGASAPLFLNAPAGKPYQYAGETYAAGAAWGYSILVQADCIQVVIYPVR